MFQFSLDSVELVLSQYILIFFHIHFSFLFFNSLNCVMCTYTPHGGDSSKRQHKKNRKEIKNIDEGAHFYINKRSLCSCCISGARVFDFAFIFFSFSILLPLSLLNINMNVCRGDEMQI